MKVRLMIFGLFLALLVSAASMSTARAQNPAYQTTFTTSITYQNVGAASSSVVVNFYASDGTQYSVPQAALAPGAGTSLFVGSVGQVPSGFKGAAILQSSERVVATLVQLPNSTTVKNRPLSNGFAADQGGTTYLIATVLKGTFAANTIFSVQNASSGPVTVNVVLKDTVGTTFNLPAVNLPVGAAHYYDVATIASIPAGFNGAATITANGNIVATAMESSTNGPAVSAFEGVRTGASTIYMASALCNAFGGQNSAYAVQNTGASSATVTVTYSGSNSQTKTVPAGAKASFVACDVTSAGYSGSATIASTQPVIAIGKVYGLGLSTAFLGATGGSSKLAAPYVRYGDNATYNDGSRQRAFIAIQNVGASTINGNITVRYVNRDGVTVGTHTISGPIAAGAKVNSNPSNLGAAGINFGYIGGFGGGAIIEGPAGSQLSAVVRISSLTPGSSTPSVAEDYNAIPVQ